MLKKEIIKNIIYIGLILTFACITTYKIYTQFQTTRDVDYNSKSLDVVYHDNGNKISLEKVTPMTDSVGISTKGYGVSVKNNLTVPIKYKIKIIDDSDLEKENEYDVIPKEEIKVSIKEGKKINKIYYLNELEDGILLDSELNALENVDIVIRLWIQKDSTIPLTTDMEYHGIIQVIENENESVAKTK